MKNCPTIKSACDETNPSMSCGPGCCGGHADEGPRPKKLYLGIWLVILGVFVGVTWLLSWLMG